MKNLTKTLVAAGALALSTLSHALPFVNSWDVQVVGQWTDASPAGVTIDPGNLLMRWGVPASAAGQSSLRITNPAVEEVNTYFGGGVPPAAFIADSVTLTHTNRPIFAPFLTNAELTVDVQLTPTDPIFPGFPLPAISYSIDFLETFNTAPCVVNSPTPCNDIFVLVNGFLNESFDYLGETYFVNAFPIEGGSLGTLTAAACAAVGEPAGCLGFTTPENQATQLAFGLTISTERLAVPEPGSLALLGLAMAGLAVARRRRVSA